MINGFPSFHERGFYEPDHAPEDQNSADTFHLALDQLVAGGRGRRGELGELFRVVQADPWRLILHSVVFDFKTGQQVGFGGMSLLVEMGMMTSAISIANRYQHRGLGSLLRDYTKLLVGSYFPGKFKLLEINTAEGETKKYVDRMLRRSGARLINAEHGAWEEIVEPVDRDIPTKIWASQVYFESDRALDKTPFQTSLDRQGPRFYFQGREIAEKSGKRIDLVSGQNPDPLFWQGIDQIWLDAVKARIRPKLDI